MTDFRKQFLGLYDDVAYLDNAATTQMLRAAFDATIAYVSGGRANAGRGLYPLARTTHEVLEQTRLAIAAFAGSSAERTVFTKSTTESLNAVAYGLKSILKPGDEILISPFEHHANLLPWRRLAREVGATVRTMPMVNDFTLDIDGAIAMLSDRTKIIAMTMVSNVTGTVLPVKRIISAASTHNALRTTPLTVLDAAQAAPHMSIADVESDAIVFGAHKCYGPNGVGVLALSYRLASVLEPMIVGGGMVDVVRSDGEAWRDIPARYEGGTLNVEAIVGAAEAFAWIAKNRSEITMHEVALRTRLVDGLRGIEGVHVFDAPSAIGVVSFVVDGVHPHDVAELLGQRGICVRAGHHCAQPFVEQIASGGGTVRVSIAAYTTPEEIERLLAVLPEVIETLSV